MITRAREGVVSESPTLRESSQEVPALADLAPVTYWKEPQTQQTYPTSYPAYRRVREAEDRWPPRHRRLASDVDLYVSRHWRPSVEPRGNVRLAMRPDAPLRVRRIVRVILGAIRRGEPADAAIRRVSRQFGLRHARARTLLTACLHVELQSAADAISPGAVVPSSLHSA
jgi:hypothetical protein